MADTKRFSSGLLTVLLGVLALAAMAFLLYTQYGALNAARDAAAGEQVAVARARARLAELKQAKEQAAALEERLAAFDRLLPAEPDEDVLITDLQNEADRSGTRLLQIRYEKRVPRAGCTEMPFRIAFEGRYHGLLALLAELQDGPRAVRIDEVKIGKGRGELPQIRAEIAASAFCRTNGAADEGKGGAAQ